MKAEVSCSETLALPAASSWALGARPRRSWYWRVTNFVSSSNGARAERKGLGVVPSLLLHGLVPSWFEACTR